uniref:Sa1_V90T_30C n=1 Tax=synthetic construct TaxID=32630 RepID=UPI0022EC9B2A|nr:Chain A, Sa1_V90T_30C [synthetic construct]
SKTFEVNIVLNPNLDQKQLAQAKELAIKALKQYGIGVEKIKLIGNAKTVEAVEKLKQGILLVYQIEAPADRVNDLARELRILDAVRRVETTYAAD